MKGRRNIRFPGKKNSVGKYKYDLKKSLSQIYIRWSLKFILKYLQYLKNGLIKNKRMRPNYIEEIKEKKKKEKKLIFVEK